MLFFSFFLPLLLFPFSQKHVTVTPIYVLTHSPTYPPTDPTTNFPPSLHSPPPVPSNPKRKKKLKARSIKAFIKLKFPFSNFRTRLTIKFTEAMFLRSRSLGFADFAFRRCSVTGFNSPVIPQGRQIPESSSLRGRIIDHYHYQTNSSSPSLSPFPSFYLILTYDMDF